MKITFTNKIEYINWRNVWRKTYADLSRRIRLLKHSISEGQRNRLYTGGLQNELRSLRKLATELLDVRKQSKILAQQQYLAAKQVSFTASSPSVS